MNFFCLLYKKILKYNKIGIISLWSVLVFVNSANAAPEIEKATILALVHDISLESGVSEQLVYYVIAAESNFDAYAVSHCDARGLMQITKPTWEWVCRDLLKCDWDYDQNCFDPDKNIRVGVRFILWISEYLDNNAKELNDSKLRLLLACYNAGPGTVRKNNFRIPQFKETQNYVMKISSSLRSDGILSI